MLNGLMRKKRPDGRPLLLFNAHVAIHSVGPTPPSLGAEVISSRARSRHSKRMTTPAGAAPKSRSASFRDFDDRTVGRAEGRGYHRRADGRRNTAS